MSVARLAQNGNVAIALSSSEIDEALWHVVEGLDPKSTRLAERPDRRASLYRVKAKLEEAKALLDKQAEKTGRKP